MFIGVVGMSENLGQADGLMAAAVGKICPYCEMRMEAGDGPRGVTRDHLLPRCQGFTLNLGSRIGGNRVLACRSCNAQKDNRSLRAWLDDLIRSGDEKAGIVADFIADLYFNLGPEDADALVGVTQPRKTWIPDGRSNGRCEFPRCECVGVCVYAASPSNG